MILRGQGAELGQCHCLADATAPDDCRVNSPPVGLEGLPAMLDKPLPGAGAALLSHVCAGVNCLSPIVHLDG